MVENPNDVNGRRIEKGQMVQSQKNEMIFEVAKVSNGYITLESLTNITEDISNSAFESIGFEVLNQ